jgi:predicted MPP superfamily phosphohydrolase
LHHIARNAVAAAATLAIYANAVEPYWLRVRRRVLRLPGWDPALDGVRILHLSDLHIGHSTRRVVDFLRRASRIEADVAVVTGDFIQDPSGIPLIRSALRELTARHTVIGVLGNHEHRYHMRRLSRNGVRGVRHPVDTDRVVAEPRGSCVRMLVNDSLRISINGGTLTFAGIDDQLGGYDDWDRAFDGVDDPRATVLLAHTPDAHEQAAERGVALVLSGHTHGGQVHFGPWLTPITGTRMPLERPAGLIERGRTLLHISPGLATTTVPFRFFARPEMTVLAARALT